MWLPLFKGPKVIGQTNIIINRIVTFNTWLQILSSPWQPEDWIWADNIAWNTSEFILLLLSAVTSSINTREPVPLAAIHAHAITQPPPCFTDEVVCFGSWAVPSLLHTLLFPSFWYKLIFVSSVHRMLFQNCTGSFRCFLANSNLVFLFLRLTNGLHLVVNPLYLLWWSLLLIVDYDTDGECSWSGQLLWRGFSSPGK